MSPAQSCIARAPHGRCWKTDAATLQNPNKYRSQQSANELKQTHELSEPSYYRGQASRQSAF